MAQTSYSSIEYPGGSAAVDVPLDIFKLADSIEGRTVKRFSTGAVRDAMFASLDDAKKPGAVCWLDSPGGWYGWNGGAWTRIGGELLTYTSRAGGTPQPTGLLQVNFEFPFIGGTLPRVVCQHEVTGTSNPPLLIRTYKADGYLTSSSFHVHVINTTTGGGYSNYLEFSYTASGLRPAGTA